MSNGAWLFGVMNVLWSWEKEREMNGYGSSKKKKKNGGENIVPYTEGKGIFNGLGSNLV